VGFIMPSIESYMPEDFFPVGDESLTAFPEQNRTVNEEDKTDTSDGEEDIHEETVLKRSRRQAVQWQQAWQPRWQPAAPVQPTWQQARWQPWASWRPAAQPAPAPAPVQRGTVWSRTSLAEAEWYFREDPVANAHHSEWHRVTGGRPDFNRYGEHFYYMHGQMLARYEGERLSLGLGLTVHMGPEQWNQWIGDRYDPRLGWGWTARQPGVMNAGPLYWLLDSIRSYAWQLVPSGYSRGVDWGISRLGQRLEVELHNNGHDAIAGMSGGRGVMALPTGAMRDPIFYRWHGAMHDLVKEYKNRLAPYSEADLSFPGVTSVSASVRSEGGEENTFYTYREMASVNLDSLESTFPGSRMSLQYSRMNHRPFTWDIVINTNLRARTPAIVRLFMMPTRGGGNNRVTIHMDHFYMDLTPGVNRISRDEMEAPHLSKSRWSLSELQDGLMNGQVNRRQFSWGGCGWPRHLNIPRGTERGMDWTLVVMVSQVLPADIPRLGAWAANRNLAWSYCGVGWGVVPDSRPLGFPTDRDFVDIRSLVRRRRNWATVPVRIVHGAGEG